nr:hypothetical protein CFP56_64464 [Quercus suber]
MLKPRLLSREEEAELAQSKKKVKDIHHADFNDGTREEPCPARDRSQNLQGRKSFNDKIIGEISGAFVEAFDLIDQMEEDPDSNDDDVEVGDLYREGVIKLNELLIELYVPEVLKEIGEHIGKVLRIDCHTAMEARGKYARLCIQVDLNKPLINTVIIGRFEQRVSYECIQRLCFSCGRVGHNADNYSYTIRKGKSLLAATEEDQVAQPLKPRAEHEGCHTSANDGMPNVCEEGDLEGQYGPLMVV